MEFQPRVPQTSKPFSNKVLIRLAIYAVVLGYLALDLFVFKGFLYQRLYQETTLKPALGSGEEEIIAVCYGEAIRRKDLRAQVSRLAWNRGIDYASASESERFALRKMTLESLLMDRHLAVRARLKQMEVDEAAVEEELAMLWRSWGGLEQATQRLASINWDESKLRQAIEREQLGAAYLEQLIAPDLAAIGEEQARAWHEEHQADLTQARRARFGQIFLSSLNKDAAQVGARLTQLRTENPLPASGKPVAELIAQSMDERSKQKGGSLGWIAFPEPAPKPTLDPLPEGLREPMSALQPGQDLLLQSNLGWHWIWLESEWQPARPLEFAEVKEEILIHLRNREREQQLEAIADGLRQETYQVWISQGAGEEFSKPLPSLQDYSATAQEISAPAQVPPQ